MVGENRSIPHVGIAGFLALGSQQAVERARQYSALKQVFALLIISIVLGVAGNAFFGDLRNHDAGVAAATASTQGGKYRIGTLEDAENASAGGSALLVDARREEDYRLGTIAGAVNVPITDSIWATREYLENLDRDVPIVVFCQSARCDYGRTIGTQIASLGFTDVTVCDEGWSEFAKKHHW